MSDATRSNEFFDTLAKVLLRCWLLGLLLVLLMWIMYILAGNLLYSLHGDWFGLSRNELDLILYCWMGSSKLIVILFFFFPWLAIRLVLRRAKE